MGDPGRRATPRSIGATGRRPRPTSTGTSAAPAAARAASQACAARLVGGEPARHADLAQPLRQQCGADRPVGLGRRRRCPRHVEAGDQPDPAGGAAASAEAAPHNPPRAASNKAPMLRPTSLWIDALDRVDDRASQPVPCAMPGKPLQARQPAVAQIGDQHRSRRVGDAEFGPGLGDHRLRGHAAGPEHRQLVRSRPAPRRRNRACPDP